MTASLLAAVAVVAMGMGVHGRLHGHGRPAPVRLGGDEVVVRRWRRRARSAPPVEADMAEWCEHVARGMRSGSSLRRAMDDAGRAVPAAAPALAPALAALDRGHGLGPAIAALDQDPSSPVGLVANVLGACTDLGGPAARPLDRTAATLHARAAERAERLTASAQARLSARVLTALPAGTLCLLAAAEPTTRSALATPAGMACVTAGGASNVAGWLWMRRVIARST